VVKRVAREDVPKGVHIGEASGVDVGSEVSAAEGDAAAVRDKEKTALGRALGSVAAAKDEDPPKAASIFGGGEGAEAEEALKQAEDSVKEDEDKP